MNTVLPSKAPMSQVFKKEEEELWHTDENKNITKLIRCHSKMIEHCIECKREDDTEVVEQLLQVQREGFSGV